MRVRNRKGAGEMLAENAGKKFSGDLKLDGTINLDQA